MRIPGSQRTETIPGGANVAPISPVAAAAPYQALAGMGEAISGLGEVLLKRQAKMREERDYLDAINAGRKLRDYVRARNAEAKTKLGQNALDIYPIHDQDITTKVQQISETLSEGARARFRDIAESVRDSSLTEVSNHVAAQFNAYRKDSRNADLGDRIKIIAENPLSFDAELQKGNAVIDATTPGPEGVLEKDKFYKTARIAQLDTLLRKDNLIALGISEDYMDSIRDQIGEDLYLEYKDKFKTRRNALEVEEKRQQTKAATDAKEALRMLREDQENIFLKMYQEHSLTVPVILDSMLEPKRKEHFIDAVKKQAEGKDPFSESDPLYVDQQLDLALAGKIDPLTVRPIPNKISRQDANIIRETANRSLDPNMKYYNDLETDALNTVEKQISKSSLLAGFDPDSEDDVFRAKIFLRTLLRNEKDLETRIKMLTPGTKEYVVKKAIDRMFITLPEELERKTRRMREKFKKDDQNKPQRKIGETPEQYLDRIRKK